jgi:hypothetical protein
MDWSGLEPWGSLILLAGVVIALAQLTHRLLRPAVRRMVGWSVFAQAVVRRCDRSVQAVVPLVVLQLGGGRARRAAGLAIVQHLNGCCSSRR